MCDLTTLCLSVCPSIFEILSMANNQKIQSTDERAAELLRAQDVAEMSAEHVARLRDIMAMAVSGKPGDARKAARDLALVSIEIKAAQKLAMEALTGAGDLAVAFRDRGAVHALGRDGLALLARTKALTEAQVNVAMSYRYLYEQAGAGAGLGSQLEDKPRAVRASTDNLVAGALHRAYVGVRLTDMERAVMRADRTGRAITVLRAVAGDGRTLRSLGNGGNVKAANKAALILALDVLRSSARLK